VQDRHRPREVGEKDDARLERRDEERLAARIVRRYLGPEFTDANGDLRGRKVDLADAVVG
jgi:hypothetical protein